MCQIKIWLWFKFFSSIKCDWTATFLDENGHKIRHTQDAYGRTIKVEEYNGSQIYTTAYKYDTLDNLIRVTDNQNNNAYFTYDSLGRKIKVNDPDMGIWNYEYDAAGNLIRQVDARGQLIEFEYDGLNRIRVKKSGGKILSQYYYDDPNKAFAIGRLSKITDPSGSAEFFYDQLGRQIKTIKTVSGASFTIERAYDALDRVVTLKYPDAEVLTYSYNPQGIENIKGLSPKGTDHYVTNVDYSPTSQITRIEYGNNTYTDYAYDPNTLRISDILTQGPQGKIQDLNYYFDNVGNVKNIQDYVNTQTQSFLYDDLNRLISAQGSYGSFTYNYDSIGNITYKEGINYSYNSSQKPHALRSTSDSATFEYDSNGNMISKKGLSLTQDFLYDAENRLIKVKQDQDPAVKTISIYLPAGVNFISLPFGPTYKIKDLLALIQTSRQEVVYWDTTQKKYLYNVNDPDFDQFDTLEYGKGYWIYITNPKGVTLNISGRIPDQQQVGLKQGWNPVGCPKDTETDIEEALKPLQIGVDYSLAARFSSSQPPYYQLYNKNTYQQFTKLKPGEGYWIKMIKDATWNINNNPSAASLAEFTYDSGGNRVKKLASGKTTIYIESLYESDSDGTTRKHIFVGANRICTKGLSLSYYHSDHLGSSNVITDQSGNQVRLAEYTPFGSFTKGLIPSQGTVPDYLFNGKELDRLTNLYYYGARYYNPALAKFIQPDPIIQDVYDPQNLNHYAYCRNNPLILTDPAGLAFGSFGSYGSGWSSSYSGSFSPGWSSFSGSGSSSFSSYGSSRNNGSFSSWDYHSLSSPFNNYSTSWGYNQIGNTFSNWSITSNSLNSFTTHSMMTFSNLNTDYQTAGSILNDWRGSGYSLGQVGNGLNNFGSSLIGGISSPFAQTSISAINRGAGAYFSQWASTIREYAPGWSQGIARATGFQSAFQGLGILQSSFGYMDIMNRVSTGELYGWRAYTAIGIHAVGMIMKVAGTTGVGAWGASWGGPWGAVGTAATIGTGISYGIDKAEEWLFKQMEIR